jgi:phospho-N-acetylmuramoyl-pentapeptide-transferase
VGVFVIGAGNAVNITDGLDGLAIVPVRLRQATGMIVYLRVMRSAEYLQVHYVKGTGGLAVICGRWWAGPRFRWFMRRPP